MIRRDHPAQRLCVTEWTVDELAHVHTTPPSDANNGRNPSDWWPKGTEWYGGLTKAAAIKMMAGGWSEGVARVADLARDITPPEARTVRRKPRWADEGQDLSVDRALAGQWDSAWRDVSRVACRGLRSVSLFTMWGGHCGLTSDEIFWVGATALVLADVLESAGYAVSLTASNLVIDGHYSHAINRTDIIVKRHEDPLVIDNVAAVMCHAGIFRSYGFAAMVRGTYNIGESYGYPRMPWEPSHRERMAAAGEIPEDHLIIGGVHDRDSCIEEISRIIKLFE